MGAVNSSAWAEENRLSFMASMIQANPWPVFTVAGRGRGPRADFIPDADRWADLWEDGRPALYASTSSDGRYRGTPPWEKYDVCALPVFAVWPAIDRALATWRRVRALPTEAKHRCRLAADAIRYGEQERW